MTNRELKKLAQQQLRRYQVRSTRSAYLVPALRRGKERELEEGEVFCRQGAPSVQLFILVSGSVRILRKDNQAKDRELTTISAPCIIGEMGLIDGSVRSATCVANEDCLALSIDQLAFDQLMNEDSSSASAFRHQLIAVMMADLSRTNAQIALPVD
jgi:CRP-like cAMP-binding protein